MIDCVAIGDSIAVGVGKQLGCEMRAFVGYSSTKIIKLANGKYHKVCIISAGSNDPKNPNLDKNLLSIRKAVNCSFVVWILPVDKYAKATVLKIATKDSVISFKPSVDNIHPVNYNTLALDIIKEIGNK